MTKLNLIVVPVYDVLLSFCSLDNKIPAAFAHEIIIIHYEQEVNDSSTQPDKLKPDNNKDSAFLISTC